MPSGESKPTKKQLKAQQFKKSKEEREHDKKRNIQKAEEAQASTETTEPPKKKRKTRRGKGGKGKDGKKANRFIIFVGSLPKDITETELLSHFKSSNPDHIRLRPDKNIAFLEFDADKDPSNIQRRMDIALMQHRGVIKGSKINVELTVGGGGNSENRLQKLKQKNEKMEQERQERMKNLIAQSRTKSRTGSTSAPKTDSAVPPAPAVHPDRAKLLQ
ncbi:Nop6p Ecym_6424 [Eremothecium cymbalariae DBVPG|uniref:RRM domain-containing protein n=1 Tax=Eremothecium cymbalariae (strain CBS 270.75 / DBVPG 7215 / KCTC 17166 / NRRL Y-17582) TaxID=931890 RepID=G8JUL6_ERECY|nr:hypothetical protein Ecym_6424 [Eremothecium cymbalariae DBVPG\